MQADEFADVLAAVRAFVRKDAVSRESEIEETDEVPKELRAKAVAMGLAGYTIPAEYGGLGMSLSEDVQIAIELGYTAPALRSMFGTNNGIAGSVLVEAGTGAQRAAWLPRMAAGEVIASFALTEPDAGSDPSSIVTRAERTARGYSINGTKRFITNAPTADLFVVFARTEEPSSPGRGISVFLVPRDTPGVTVGAKDRKMGQSGTATAEVYFSDAEVPAEALVGDAPGDGFATAMRALARGRVHIAALCVGMAGRLIDESLSWATMRRQSGEPISGLQLVQAMLADSQTEQDAGRAMVLDAARKWDSGVDRRLAPSCAKYFCSEMVGRVADRAVQIHGGMGYMRGTAVERCYRDARLFRIYEGTSQVQQLIIAREMLRRYSSDSRSLSVPGKRD
jgi:acyl-CoA dehydrogenase